jgi:hypothetical protein
MASRRLDCWVEQRISLISLGVAEVSRARLMASTSVKLREALRDDLRREEIRRRALAHERQNRCGEGCPQRPRLGRAGVGIPESGQRLGGKVVVTAGLDCG